MEKLLYFIQALLVNHCLKYIEHLGELTLIIAAEGAILVSTKFEWILKHFMKHSELFRA